jgi:hypothetical protein
MSIDPGRIDIDVDAAAVASTASRGSAGADRPASTRMSIEHCGTTGMSIRGGSHVARILW